MQSSFSSYMPSVMSLAKIKMIYSYYAHNMNILRPQINILRAQLSISCPQISISCPPLIISSHQLLSSAHHLTYRGHKLIYRSHDFDILLPQNKIFFFFGIYVLKGAPYKWTQATSSSCFIAHFQGSHSII